MKKCEKGFMLVETLVVSTLVSVVLIGLYVQFNNIINNFDRDTRYNNINNLYAAQNVKNFILNERMGQFYNDLKTILSTNIQNKSSRFLTILTDCSTNSTNAYKLEDATCANFTKLTEFYKINRIIFTLDTVGLEEVDYQLLDSSNFERFIKRIKNNTEVKYDDNGVRIHDYRIIIEFEGNEYATLTIAN